MRQTHCLPHRKLLKNRMRTWWIQSRGSHFHTCLSLHTLFSSVLTPPSCRPLAGVTSRQTEDARSVQTSLSACLTSQRCCLLKETFSSKRGLFLRSCNMFTVATRAGRERREGERKKRGTDYQERLARKREQRGKRLFLLFDAPESNQTGVESCDLVSVVPLVGPLRDPMACCSSDTLRRRTTSARADFSSWISSSCIWTLCSREAIRSVTSILLAADALSSEETVTAGLETHHRRRHSFEVFSGTNNLGLGGLSLS